MAEYEFASLLPEVQADVPGVNEPAVIRCARNAVRYFCDRTGFLKYAPAAVDIVADQHTYEIPADSAGRIICYATEVWVDGQLITHRSADQLDREQGSPRERDNWTIGIGSLTYNSLNRNWRTETEYPPKYWHQDEPNTVRLVGIPDQASTGGLIIKAALKPAAAHRSVDEAIVNNWYEVLVLGTKAGALLLQQKSWSNPNLGATYQAAFEAEVERVAGDATAGFAQQSHVIGHVRAHP